MCLALRVKSEAPFTLKRSEAYIGVLIDDLITKELKNHTNVYLVLNMKTPLLVEDNADIRCSQARSLGLASKESALEALDEKQSKSDDFVFVFKTAVFLQNK